MADDSMNSFGEHRSYTEGSDHENTSLYDPNHTIVDIEGEENKEPLDSSSDTASFNEVENVRAFNSSQSPIRFSPYSYLGDLPDIPIWDHPRLTNPRSSGLTISNVPVRIQSYSQENPSLRTRPSTEFEDQVDDILNDISTLTDKENAKLEENELVLMQQRLTFEDYLGTVKEEIRKEKKAIEKNFSLCQKILNPEVIELDIGGTHYIATTRTTLCKIPDSALAAMFSGNHPLKTHKGKVFIDRDGDIFCMLISYLRNNKLPVFEDKAYENLFYEELNYWGISPIRYSINFEQFDPLWCASSLKLDFDNTIIKKNGPLHGVVFCKYPFSSTNKYVEFRVVMKNNLKPIKSSFFLGAVNRSLYNKEQLASTFWKDSPGSFYYDVWSCRLVKIDDLGQQTGMAADYGCACKDEENILGIMYDEDAGTLAYYKNGMNIGIAFHNVPNGLYPAIDIWFETGYVEIVKRTKPMLTNYL